MNRHNDLEVIDLLIEKQSLLADLYALFAKSYHNYEEFWAEAAHQECQHAQWLESFREMIVTGKLCYHIEGNSFAAIESFIKHLKGTIVKFNEKPFTLERALAVATDVERSLVNKNSLDRFDGHNRSVNKLLELLRENRRLSAIKMEAVQIFRGKELAGSQHSSH